MFISRGTQAGCGVLQSIPARSAKPLHLSLLRNELLSSTIIFLLDSIAETKPEYIVSPTRESRSDTYSFREC